MAFAELFRRYNRPVFVIALNQCLRSGFNRQDAEDITQDFFLGLLHNQAFKTVQRVGSFRAFLGVCFNRHFIDWIRKKSAKKRGGELFIDSLEAKSADGEIDLPVPHPVVFGEWDIRWAQRKFELARDRVRVEYEDAGKKPLFDYLADHCASGSSTTYAEIAKVLNKTVDSVKKEAERMRHSFRESFSREVALDFRNPYERRREIEDEVAYLSKLLCSVPVP